MFSTLKGFDNKTKDFDPKSADSQLSAESLESYEADSSSQLLYKFMKGLFELADLIKTDRKYMNYMSQFAPDY